MTVNDIQSGMGIYSNRDYNENQNHDTENEDLPNTGNQDKKIEYNTKAENRKREIKERAQQPLNSLCNCGSNKKYKHCCIKKIL